MTLVWEYSRFRGSRLLLMLAIADHCNDDLIAWPSRAHLAHKIRMSERYTKALIDELIASKPGELRLIDPGGGRGHSPRYKIVVAAHEKGLRSGAGMEVHKGGGRPHLLAKGGGGQQIKGDAGLQKTLKGGGGPPERGMPASPEPSLTIINTLTQTATATNAAAVVADVVWKMGALAQSSKLPKAKRAQLEEGTPSPGAFVSKYLYALAHAGFRKPALWAAAQVIENPGAWEGQPFEALAAMGPDGLAHVLAWIRDDGAYPLSVNGAGGAALAFRAHMQSRHSKQPAQMYVAIDDAINDLGLSALAVAPALPDLAIEEIADEPVTEPNIWQHITERLRNELSRAQHDRLLHCHLLSADEHGIVLGVPGQSELDWLQNRMGKMLADRFAVSLRLEE